MKKIFSLFLLMSVVFLVAGCSEEKRPKAENDHSSDQTVKEIVNLDEVYEFINELNPGKYSKEDFNKWKATYLDVTGDGKEEVIFSTTYWDGQLENLMVIEVLDSGYKIIPSDIELAKYENGVSIRDGFLLLSRKTGGSGMYDTSLSVYVFDGEKMKNTGLDIVLENVFSQPTGYLITGEIDGNMYEFTYSATKEDYATEETSCIIKERYIYDPVEMKYNLQNLDKMSKEK